MSLKKIFLLSLLALFLTTRIEATPKRPFEKTGSDSQSPTAEEQTDDNRSVADRTGSNDNEKDDSAKRIRSDNLEVINSEATSEGQEITSSSPTSTIRDGDISQYAYSEVRANNQESGSVSDSLTKTHDIPTLERLCLEKLMRLPKTHPVFSKGLPDLIHLTLIEPYEKNITQVIQGLHRVYQEHFLDQLPPNEKETNLLIITKQKLEKIRANFRDELSKGIETNYPKILFFADVMKKTFPNFIESVSCLKEIENYKNQLKLALSNKQLEKTSVLKVTITTLFQQAKLWSEMIKTQKRLQTELLQNSPADEVKSLHKTIANQRKKMTRIVSIVDQQKIFLERLEQFDIAKKKRVIIAFQEALNILNNLDAILAKPVYEQESFSSEILDVYNQIMMAPISTDPDLQLIQEKMLNAYDQIVKASVSTHPDIQQVQDTIIEINQESVIIDFMIAQAKTQQLKIIYNKNNRITYFKDHTTEVRPEAFIPIFELYQIPLSFLDKEIDLLEEAESDLLEGKKELSKRKKILAIRWRDLAIKKAAQINTCSQLGIILTPEGFFNHEEQSLIDALNTQEGELKTQAPPLEIDQKITSLLWDFSKTFEENVETASAADDL